MNQQFGFMAPLQRIAIKRTGWYAETDHGLYAVINCSYTHAHVCTKGETGQYYRQAGVTAAQKLQGKAHIVHLSTPFVICSCAMSYTTKVEAQRRHTERLQCLCHLENHFIMHRAAA